MKALAFIARYAHARPEPPTDAALAADGFQLYRPKVGRGRSVWFDLIIERGVDRSRVDRAPLVSSRAVRLVVVPRGGGDPRALAPNSGARSSSRVASPPPPAAFVTDREEYVTDRGTVDCLTGDHSSPPPDPRLRTRPRARELRGRSGRSSSRVKRSTRTSRRASSWARWRDGSVWHIRIWRLIKHNSTHTHM